MSSVRGRQSLLAGNLRAVIGSSHAELRVAILTKAGDRSAELGSDARAWDGVFINFCE